jgi:hypothetical protein
MLLLAALLLAQTQTVTCNDYDLTLPPNYASWTRPDDWLAPGHTTMVDVAGGGGTIGFTIAKAGIYSIALDQKGWIDVNRGAVDQPSGKLLVSVSHREGDACWTIRKVVRFRLDPGPYQLSITKVAGPNAKVMLAEGE